MSVGSNENATLRTEAELADQQIMKEIGICILVMMGIAVAIFVTANSIA